MAGVLLLLGRSQKPFPEQSVPVVRCRVRAAFTWTYQFGSFVPCAGMSRSITSVGSDSGGSHQIDASGTRLEKEIPQRRHPGHDLAKVHLWFKNQYKACSADFGIAPTVAQLQSAHRRTQGSSTVQYSRPGDEVESLCEKGQLDRALGALFWMDQQGEVPSVTTYIYLLKACAKRKSLAQAKQVHAHLVKHRLESTNELGDHIVSTFVKCGSLEDAVSVFHRLPSTSVLSWTALISGYVMSGCGQEALRTYRRMQEKGVRPKPYTFVALLKACGSLANLEHGKWIHAEALRHRCESDIFVRTGLIDMYGKCGSMVDAQNLFFGLSQRDVVSWNVMLTAYTKQGQAEKAIELYNQMRKEGVNPNDRTFVSVLQACGMVAEKEEHSRDELWKVNSLEKGKEIHADARAMGYDTDVYVGNTLVSVYGKCGNMLAAWDVFRSLSHRSVVSWNAMLAALAQQRQPEKALELYREMLEAGVSPNDRTFVSILQTCSIFAEKEEAVIAQCKPTKVVSLEMGRLIHGQARMKGYDVNVFVGNTLVTMYGRCGSLADAGNVFDRLVQPDLVSWNAMLAAHVEQGQAEEALQQYEHMLREGRSPDGLTLVCVLQACGILAEKEEDVLVEGQAMKMNSIVKLKTLHVDAHRKGYSSDGLLANTLVNMYSKCGSAVDAQNIFDRLPQHDVVSWNVMLAAYNEQVQAEKALELYELMREECVSPDARTFVSMIQACGMLAEKEKCSLFNGQLTKVESLGKGKAIHSDTQKKWYNLDVFVICTLISMYSKCGSILDAEQLFYELHPRDAVSWNAMLRAYVEQAQEEEALLLYEQLQSTISPDAWTFVSVLQACSMLAGKQDSMVDGEFTKAKLLKRGKAVHTDIRRKGYDSDVFVTSALVSMYGRCGSILDAENVFDGLPFSRSVVSWNSMLAAYAQGGDLEKAVDLYRRMQVEGVSADNITLICILQACSHKGSLELCRQIHRRLVGCGNNISLPLANTLIAAYGRCASMVEAQTVFNVMPQPDEVSWNALIAGYTRQGNYASSLQCFNEMQLAGIQPNRVTFLSMLCMCSHAGLVDKGVHYFESMSREYGIIPTVEHYVCMLDLFGRAGYFERVGDLLTKMSAQPDIALWLCLLGACRKHGQVFLAEQAFDRAVCLQPKQAAAYILMSDIYADFSLWDHSIKVKKLGDEEGVWKKASQTWIEYEHQIHKFAAGVSTLLN